jgi:bromodomain-containing protein 4
VKLLLVLSRYAKIPDEPLGGTIGVEKSSTSSTTGSESSTSSESESDDSEAERVRKLALLQEQVRLVKPHWSLFTCQYGRFKE